ncbi:hypothetical protein ABK040_013398 [Willaertia magna]
MLKLNLIHKGFLFRKESVKLFSPLNIVKYYNSCIFNRNNNDDDFEEEHPVFDGHIPKEKLIYTFSRSSGPGGQNVNKVNTKADIRLHIDSADWLPDIVKERLKELKANKINKDGELIIQASTHRTQEQNIKEAIQRLKEYIEEAYEIPDDWKPREGRTEKGDAVRLKEKKKQSDKKQRRQEGKRIKDVNDYY